jgi:hypothetical protein
VTKRSQHAPDATPPGVSAMDIPPYRLVVPIYEQQAPAEAKLQHLLD